jgi:hypothetical protein
MHPEITREMVRAQQADLSRHASWRSAQIRSEGGVVSPRTPRRSRPIRGGLRVALRHAARLSPRTH